jgi:CsoR family transcriptional regulator, copper-sensing transcriptional repressor
MNSDPAAVNYVAKSCEKALGDDRSVIRPDRLKSDLTARLSRIEGQVRGVRNMIDNDIYCDDILNQITAVQAAMKAVSRLVLRNHIQGCVVDKICRGDREIVDELLVTISKLN